MVYPSLEEWQQDVYAHNKQRRLDRSTAQIEEQTPLVYWKPVDQDDPMPNDAISFSDKQMSYHENSGLTPRSYIIARTECKSVFESVKYPYNLAKYVIDLGHREYEDPYAYELVVYRFYAASATRSDGRDFPPVTVPQRKMQSMPEYGTL
ncbi:hypothetical protein Pst134EB_005735 [Puccinia striiformis f. sp. tritici]|nr:hypothetical protein Pst134EB_005735 [Puccinia striiformis f. sp. tritici]